MAEPVYIHIPRWDEFQHDRRRRGAPWHKEYARQLDNDAWLGLSQSQRGILVGLRLMYGRREPEGVSYTHAMRTLCATYGEATWFGRNVKALNHAGFVLLSASTLLAPCAQDAHLEVEVEVEKNGFGVRSAATWERISDELIQAQLPPNTETDLQSQEEDLDW